MSAERRHWVTLGVVALAIGGTAAVGLLRPAGAAVEPGTPAPEFSAIDIATGAPTSLAAYRGRVVLLNVWATWCMPCRLEMPSMERLHRAFAGTDLRLVAVSVDRADIGVVRAFVRELGLTFEVLHDRAGDIEGTYRTVGVPESFLIDRDGVIIKKVVGATEWDTPATQALVRRLLDGG